MAVPRLCPMPPVSFGWSGLFSLEVAMPTQRYLPLFVPCRRHFFAFLVYTPIRLLLQSVLTTNKLTKLVSTSIVQRAAVAYVIQHPQIGTVWMLNPTLSECPNVVALFPQIWKYRSI